MVKGIDVNLTIRDNTTGAYYRIPVVPPTIPYKDGDAIADTVHILNLGNVDFINGVDLDSMEWASIFPARYDASYCSFNPTMTPLEYRALFQGWKNAGTRLQVICAAAGINTEMQLRSFSSELTGFEGDVGYNVTFRQYKRLRPQKIAVTTSSSGAISKNTKTPESRPPATAKGKPATYTVKAGDTLTGIAKKIPVASWKTLYDKNKAVIGANPNKLRAGQVLTV